MVSNIGTLEPVNFNMPSAPEGKSPSLGGSLAKLVFFAGLNKLTFQKIGALRNRVETAKSQLLDATVKLLGSQLSGTIAKELQKAPGLVRERLSSMQCKSDPEGFKDKALNAVKHYTGVNQAAELANEMTSTVVDLLTKTNDGTPPDTLSRLLFLTGLVCRENKNMKEVFDGVKTAFLDKVFSKEFISFAAGKAHLGVSGKVINFFVARLGIKNLTDKFISDHLLAGERLSRMELRDVYEVSMAKGMQAFINLDGNNWDREKIDKTFASFAQIDPAAVEFKHHFNRVAELYNTSHLAQTATHTTGFILYNIIQPLVQNVSSNVKEMSPEQFCKLLEEPKGSQIAGLIFGKDLDSATQFEQMIDGIANAGHALTTNATHMVASCTEAVTEAITKAKDSVRDTASKLKDMAATKLEQGKEAAATAISAAGEMVVQAKDVIVGAAVTTLDHGKELVADAVATVGEAATQVKDGVINTATDIKNAAAAKIEHGKELVADTVATVGEAAAQVKDAITGAADKVLKAVTPDFNIDISDAFDDDDDWLGGGSITSRPAPKDIPSNTTPAGVNTATFSENELRSMLHWDRPHTMDLQNTLNEISVQDNNPIQDVGRFWTATYPLMENFKNAILDNRLTFTIGGNPLTVADDSVKSTVVQLHSYAVNNSSRDDATHVITSLSKLLDAENLKLFLPEELRGQALTPPEIKVNILSQKPLTFTTETTWTLADHQIQLQFTADIKEISKSGWTGSTITGNFASRDTRDPEKDSLRNIRYSVDGMPV